MDLFLLDVLDSHQLPPNPDFLVGKTVNFEALLKNNQVLCSIAFNDMWQEAWGVPSNRVAFFHFMNLFNQNGIDAKNYVENVPKVVECIKHTFISFSPFQFFTTKMADSLLGNAFGKFERSIVNLDKPEVVLAKLYHKLANRYNAEIDSSRSFGSLHEFVMEYVNLVTNDKLMAGLCKEDTCPSIQIYHQKLADVRKKMSGNNGTLLNILSNNHVQIPTIPILSANELVSIPFMLDMPFWKDVMGGAIFISSKQEISGLTVKTAFVEENVLPYVLHVFPRNCVYHLSVECKNTELANKLSQHIMEDQKTITHDIEFPNIQNSDISCTNIWLPKQTELYGANSPPAWAKQLSVNVMSCFLATPRIISKKVITRFQNDTQITQPVAPAGQLMFNQLLVGYAKTRNLGTRVFKQPTDLQGNVMMIETRINPMSVLTCLVTLDNLDSTKWGLVVLCSNHNKDWITHCIKPHVPHAQIQLINDVVPESATGPDIQNNTFNIQTYNKILKSEELWTFLKLKGPRVLTIQDDGAIIKQGLEKDLEIMDAMYVGSPWNKVHTGHTEMLIKAGIDGDQLVGNGGISLRNTARMLEIVQNNNDKLSLYADNRTIIPEDVFFARKASCPRKVAERFAYEMTQPNINVFGFHKPWAYNQIGAIMVAFDYILNNVDKNTLEELD